MIKGVKHESGMFIEVRMDIIGKKRMTEPTNTPPRGCVIYSSQQSTDDFLFFFSVWNVRE
jgi:hypothetical protein